MRRHDVPEQHVVLDPELPQDPVHDRRGRLGGAIAGQLPLGRERESAHTRTSIACGFADEDRFHVPALSKVRTQPSSPQQCERSPLIRKVP